jgi:hypothetical protein|nr:hypothetical protein [uncultured Peptostreptococcus sp.]
MLLGRRRALWISALLIMNGFNRRKRDKDLAGGNDGNNLKLPSFKNALEVKSSIPGRVRFYAPILVGNIEVANSFVDQISKIDVIKTCRVNTLTGTILMEYDHLLLDPQTLEGAVIKLLGVDKSIDEGRVSEVKKASERLFAAVNNGLYDFTNGLLDVKSLAGIALIGAGLLDLRRNGGGRLPDYATLGWWGTSLFMM